jgi:TIR domain
MEYITHDAGRHRTGQRLRPSVQHGNSGLRRRRMSVFYAHEDELHRKRFRKALAGLRRQGLIMWDDRDVDAGVKWEEEIIERFSESDSIVFLVSPDLLDSDYVYVEMQLALELHDRQLVPVIPVIVRPADWEESPLGIFQALPENGRAVSIWQNKDQAWQDITKGIRKIVA